VCIIETGGERFLREMITPVESVDREEEINTLIIFTRFQNTQKKGLRSIMD